MCILVYEHSVSPYPTPQKQIEVRQWSLIFAKIVTAKFL